MKRKFVKTKTELIFMKLVDQTNNKRFSCLVEENTITCSINILTLRALKILIQFMLVFSRTYELKRFCPTTPTNLLQDILEGNQGEL